MIELITGGARSGKSRYAEKQSLRAYEKLLARTGQAKLYYLATATAGDDEMLGRIERHRQRRNSDWLVLEEPLNLAERLREVDADDTVVLIDCMTLWLSNCLFGDGASVAPVKDWARFKGALLDVIASFKGRIFIVSNEVGLGVIPVGEISRQYVDEAGWLNQDIAAVSDVVTLVVAGLPVKVK